MVAQQEDATARFEAESKHALSRQHEGYAHRQHALFQEFDGPIKDKDETVHALQRALVNHKEQALTELEQAHMDVKRMANVPQPVFADGPSTQPYATPVQKKTVNAVAAVAQATPVQVHAAGLFLGR